MKKLKNVLLQGFARVEDIEPAVMEQHRDRPEEEKEQIRRQHGEFRSFYNDSEDSHSLFASLVIVDDLAYNTYDF